MYALEEIAEDALKTGLLATAATTLAASALGEFENGNAIAPINAISHIAWGDRAANQKNLSLKYTLTRRPTKHRRLSRLGRSASLAVRPTK